MTIERALRLIAGSFLLLSLALSVIHSQNWLFFSAFIGLNLFQSGFTNWCPMTWILQKMGFRREVCAIKKRESQASTTVFE